MKKSNALLVAAAVVFSGALFASAEDAAKGAGSLSGTVVNSAGTKVAGVVVKIMAPRDPASGGPTGRGGSRRSDVFNLEPTDLAHGTALATATTDADGKFTFKTLKVGEFNWEAGSALTVGFANGKIKIEDGKEATVDIKLGAPMK